MKFPFYCNYPIFLPPVTTGRDSDLPRWGAELSLVMRAGENGTAVTYGRREKVWEGTEGLGTNVRLGALCGVEERFKKMPGWRRIRGRKAEVIRTRLLNN